MADGLSKFSLTYRFLQRSFQRGDNCEIAKLKKFKNQLSPEPLGQSQQNLAQSILG